MNKKKRSLFRFLVVLLTVATVFCGSIGISAAENAESGIMINVVYDDSNSMVIDSNKQPIKRWSQAKYAMEVFCAMMGESDIMNIYPMSLQGKLGQTVYGNDPNRVQTIHDMNGDYLSTPFDTVKNAVKDLKEADDSYEKWLVIITDGSFDNGKTSPEYVQARLNEYNESGIKTVYLGIGDKAPAMQSNPDMGAYAEKASDGADLLKKITNIANQIFEHLVLPTGFIKTNNNVHTLSFDIPVNQIVVFAQGDAVSVGTMSHNGKEIQPVCVEYVKYSDKKPKNFGGAEVDTSLKGVVVTFSGGEELFPGGDYSIPVSDAKTVEFYYNPGVEVNCGLLYGGKLVQSEDKLYAGEYEVEMNFVNPLTGTPVQSELLSSVDFVLRAENNGEYQILTAQTGTVTLVEGDVTISAVAQLPGAVELTNKRQYKVYPEPIELKLDITSDKSSYSQDEIGPEASPITLTAVNSLNGEPIKEAEWKNATVSVTQSGGIRWNAECADQVGSWHLTPVSVDGSIFSIEVGEPEFDVEVAFDYEGQYAYGAGAFSLRVDEYTGNELKFEVSSPEGGYALAELGDVPEDKVIKITGFAENPMTGEFMPLSQELWDATELKVSADEKMDFSVVKGTEVGTWYVTPKYYHGDPLLTDHGDIGMRIEAEAELGELRYRGGGSSIVQFEKLSLDYIIPILLPRLIAVFILLWILIGHATKKRIRVRKLDPRCKYRGKQSAKRRIVKEWFSVLWPNGPERARVCCRNSDFKCDFDDLRIEAAGRNSFRIINKRLPLNRMKICGQIYKDMDEVRKEKFSYSTFDISSINPRENNRTMGTFSFL